MGKSITAPKIIVAMKSNSAYKADADTPKTAGTVNLRQTRLADLDFVIDAEQHPDNAPYVYQWQRTQHEGAIGAEDSAHLIVEHVVEGLGTSIGYMILAGLCDPHKVLLLQRIVIVDKGRGYGRQTLQWIKAFTFDYLDYHRLQLDVVASNERARSLYLSEGFAVEGTLKEAHLKDGNRENLLILAMLKHEYIASRISA
ncbi:MAG: GNAT family protein [Cyanobacteria bacterium J06643_4]